MFDHGESIVFIAHSGDEPIGFAQLYPSFSSVSLKRVFVLNDLFVSEAGRRRGVATRTLLGRRQSQRQVQIALLAAVESYAASRDAARVALNVARLNAAAQALYEARGWQRDEQFFMYHRRFGS